MEGSEVIKIIDPRIHQDLRISICFKGSCDFFQRHPVYLVLKEWIWATSSRICLSVILQELVVSSPQMGISTIPCNYRFLGKLQLWSLSVQLLKWTLPQILLHHYIFIISSKICGYAADCYMRPTRCKRKNTSVRK